jgi:hypothetical protein
MRRTSFSHHRRGRAGEGRGTVAFHDRKPIIIHLIVTFVKVKLRDLDATNPDGSKGREWTVRFDDVVAEVQHAVAQLRSRGQ